MRVAEVLTNFAVPLWIFITLFLFLPLLVLVAMTVQRLLEGEIAFVDLT